MLNAHEFSKQAVSNLNYKFSLAEEVEVSGVDFYRAEGEHYITIYRQFCGRAKPYCFVSINNLTIHYPADMGVGVFLPSPDIAYNTNEIEEFTNNADLLGHFLRKARTTKV